MDTIEDELVARPCFQPDAASEHETSTSNRNSFILWNALIQFQFNTNENRVNLEPTWVKFVMWK